MAIDLGELRNKYHDVDQIKLVRWVTWATPRGLDRTQVMNFINELYLIYKSPDIEKNALKSLFRKKWNINPEDGSAIEIHEVEPENKEVLENNTSQQEPKPVGQPKKEVSEPQSNKEIEEMAISAANNLAKSQAVEEVAAEEDYEEPSEEEVEDSISDDEEQILDDDEDFEEEIPDEIEFKIPYKNPLKQTTSDKLPVEPKEEVPIMSTNDYEEIEALESDIEEESEPDFKDEDAFISKEITREEYDGHLDQHKYILEALEHDPQALVRFAQEIDLQRHPPYMQIRRYLINHPIKDPNTSTVLIYVKDDYNKDKTTLKTMPLLQAMEITKQLEDDGFLTSFRHNYKVIFNQFEENVKVLASLIYCLEIYCETQDRNPFKVNIPKDQLAKSLSASIKNSTGDLKKILLNEVLKHILGMKSEILNKFSNVNGLIKSNMDIMNNDVREIAEKVMKKVKTDLDQTNKEDVKRGHLFIFNKRRASYRLSAGVSGLYNMMLDHFESDLMNEDYKLDRVKKLKHFTIEEIQNTFGYKSPATMLKAVKLLKRHKLITMYTNGTFCLCFR
jgi:hypothetical protein